MAAKKARNEEAIKKAKHQITTSFVDAVCLRLAGNKPVRRTLPENGRLHIDRHLPFLCVYRKPAGDEDAGTKKLVKGEASYLVAPGTTTFEKSVANLVSRVTETLSAEFGAFLIVEIWATPEGGKANDPAVPSVLPTFEIHAAGTDKMTRTVEAIGKRLNRVKVLKQGVKVEIIRNGHTHPAGFQPLMTKEQAAAMNCFFIGIAVPPVFRRPDSKIEFPMLIRSLRRGLSLAMRQGYFEFVKSQTTHRPPHYHSLGRKAMVKAVWDVDRELAEVGTQFDYLMQLTPVNTNTAWKQFERERFAKPPEFHYRPLPVDPTVLKRELYRIRIERVEDPALHRIFEEKQHELEMKITMLRDRDTPRFLYESLQLFGGVTDQLLQLAKDVLAKVSDRDGTDKSPKVDAKRFAAFANAEMDYYRKASSFFTAKAVVTPTVSGLIVSRGKLMINSDLSLAPSRVKALIAHEVGVHLVTYCNGRMQPFQQLYSGLAGYEELQEGLAVLAEYLVDGLTPSRLRQLAARVIAVRQLIDGATFVDTFRSLTNDYNFTPRTAYNITMRVHRGGGLTKDAVYLRGLHSILQYVQKGGDLDPLLLGKMSIQHIPLIKELRYRNVLQPVPIVPRFLKEADAIARLERLRGSSGSVVELAKQSSSKNGIEA